MNAPIHLSPHNLVAKYIQGDLSPEESQALLRLLQHNKNVVQLLKVNLLADAWLCELKQQASLIDNQLNSEELSKLFNNTANSLEECHENEDRFLPKPERMDTTFAGQKNQKLSPNTPRKQTMNNYVFAACILLAIALGFGVYFDSQKKHSSSSQLSSVAIDKEKFVPVARVAELVDPVWAQGAVPYQRGQGIDTGKISLDKGMAKIEFQNGAVFILEAPIHFAINGMKEAFCSLGELSATCPPSAIGFRVNTPLGTVEDRGTEFFTKVSQVKLDVETNKGLVEIITPDSSSFPIKQGEAIRIGRDGANLRYVPEMPRFTTWKVFGIHLASYVAKLRKEKEQADMILDADPNLLVRFDASCRQDNTVPNMSVVGKSLCSNLTLQRAPIVEGRWNSSAAIGFTDRTKNVSFRLDGAYRCLVLTANVRFEHLGTQENTLCASRDFMKVPGAFLWQICRTGEILLFVTTGENKVKAYQSSSIMNVRDSGVWYNLSVELNADAGTISHYVNSKLISTVKWQHPQNIVPGECLLGRAPQNVLSGAGKHFDGAIEEFRISTKK